MATVIKQRDIIDIAQLDAALDARLGDEPLSRTVRAEIFALVKEALGAGRDEIRRRFEDDGASGEANVRATAYLVDQIFQFVLEATTTRVYPTAEPTSGERICVAAVGGYGRGEMAPFSDIDLLFLLPNKLIS